MLKFFYVELNNYIMKINFILFFLWYRKSCICGSCYISIGQHCCRESYEISITHHRYFTQQILSQHLLLSGFRVIAETLRLNKKNGSCHHRACIVSYTFALSHISFWIRHKNNLIQNTIWAGTNDNIMKSQVHSY